MTSVRGGFRAFSGWSEMRVSFVSQKINYVVKRACGLSSGEATVRSIEVTTCQEHG